MYIINKHEHSVGERNEKDVRRRWERKVDTEKRKKERRRKKEEKGKPVVRRQKKEEEEEEDKVLRVASPRIDSQADEVEERNIILFFLRLLKK